VVGGLYLILSLDYLRKKSYWVVCIVCDNRFCHQMFVSFFLLQAWWHIALQCMTREEEEEE